MDTKRKISILFIGTVLLYVMAFIVFETIQQHQHGLLLSSRYDILNQSIKAAIQNRETTIENVTIDYSTWDEIIDFMKDRDSTWAFDNLEYILNAHKMNMVCVYNLKKENVYSVNNCSPQKNQIFPVPNEVLDQLYLQKKIIYFISIPEGVFLVCGSTIHHTIDNDRKLPPQGYLFIAKRLDKEFLDEIGSLTASVVQHVDINHVNEIKTLESQVKVAFPLVDYKGRIVRELVFVRDFPYVNDFFLFSRISMILFIGIGLLVILALYVLFTRWVSKPLSKINYALLSGDITDIDKLKNKPNEFGQLSQLLENFMLQKKELEQQIIEKNNTERLLIESEEKFSKAFLFSPAAMMISTLDNNMIISVNESFSKMTGKGLKELQNFSINSIGVFNDPELFRTIAATLNKKQNVGAYEVFIKAQSGDLRFGILKCDIVHLQGKPCLLSVILDITDRKQVEMAMNIAREKAEESDRLKYFLLMNMSHELRTPLTGIIGFAEVIKDDSNEKLIKTLADKILISSDRLLNTLNSIMLLAEIHSGNLSIQKQKCKLGQTIAGIFNHYASLANTKSIQLNLIDEGVWIEVDPDHLRQIAIKIIENALKFTESGSVTVSISKQLLEGKNWAVLSIRDTGIGIPSDKLDDIFLEFRQVSEGVGRSFEGSGLGLSIAKNLTLLMGGNIAVESEVNVGSTFIIQFPVVD